MMITAALPLLLASLTSANFTQMNDYNWVAVGPLGLNNPTADTHLTSIYRSGSVQIGSISEETLASACLQLTLPAQAQTASIYFYTSSLVGTPPVATPCTIAVTGSGFLAGSPALGNQYCMAWYAQVRLPYYVDYNGNTTNNILNNTDSGPVVPRYTTQPGATISITSTCDPRPLNLVH